LRNGLLATGNFDEGKVQHRIFLKAANASDRIPIDLIPFGAVAEANMISWPPDQDTVMTVAGIEDALAAAVRVQIDPDLTVTVASLAGIAVLKLFAFHERSTTDKDALDLYRVISTYADAGNMERLYEDAIDLLEAEGHDLELAGAVLLGLDARRLCSLATMLMLRELFAQTDFAEKTAERVRVSRFPMEPERLRRIHQLIAKFTEQLIG
jgi:predicted nucleotidyltransferase